MTALMLMAGGASAQDRPPLYGGAALALDAAQYAAISGQTPVAAGRELALQDASVPLTDALKVDFPVALRACRWGTRPSISMSC